MNEKKRKELLANVLLRKERKTTVTYTWTNQNEKTQKKKKYYLTSSNLPKIFAKPVPFNDELPLLRLLSQLWLESVLDRALPPGVSIPVEFPISSKAIWSSAFHRVSSESSFSLPLWWPLHIEV